MRLTHSLLFAVGMIFACTVSATEFNTWKQQQLGQARDNVDEFDQYKGKLQAAFERYRKKTARVWGKANVTPTRSKWVSYIDKINQRSVVDFNQGTVTVELATTARTSDEQLQRRKLEKLILKAMLQGDDRRSMQQIANRPVSMSMGAAVLSGQISDADGNVADRDDYRSIAISAASEFTSSELQGDDGDTRIVYQAKLKLVPDHIKRRAEKYQPLITQYSIQYGIPAALINAVIETESMFNPTARSPAPAFGLMQLVPTSGARDAYKHVYNKDKIVTDKYLYDPENNIHLGTAYLAKLNTRYLSGIEQPESRMLASIAAYNTGHTNVFKAFGGSFSRSKYGSYDKYKKMVLDKINSMSPKQVYSQLATGLNSSEARNYIQKVTRRMEKYV